MRIEKWNEKFKDFKKFLREEFSRKSSPSATVQKDITQSSNDKESISSDRIPFVKSVLYVIAVLFILAIIWAKFAIVDEVTVGVGKVIPSTHIKQIQSLDGGILVELAVKEGQIVKPQEIVARLSMTDIQTEYLAAKKHYISLLAMFDRLQAEQNNSATINFDPALSDEKEVTANETALFQSRQRQLYERLQTLKNSYELGLKQLKIIKPFVAQGIVSKMDELQLETRINELKGGYNDEINKFKKDVLTDLNKTADELKTTQEKMLGLQERIARTIIRSPVHGIVKQININTLGGVVKPGGEIMEIVPLEDSLLIETRINPRDIAFIHPGQKAIVKFTAYDYSIYGGLDGEVNYISADTVVDDKGNTFYIVQVRTHRNYLGNVNKPLPLLSGMLATVDILTGKKSIADYILKPILKVKQEALREH